jgi:hypothetical protein
MTSILRTLPEYKSDPFINIYVTGILFELLYFILRREKKPPLLERETY